MVSRREFFVRTICLAGLGGGALLLAGCESGEVGSVPKLTKSKAEILKELDAVPPKKKRTRDKGQ